MGDEYNKIFAKLIATTKAWKTKGDPSLLTKLHDIIPESSLKQ